MLSNFIAALIPVLVALLALAVAWGALLTRISVMRKSLHAMPGRFATIQKDIQKDVADLELRIDKFTNTREKLKQDYLLEKDHSLMCSNAILRLEAHVTAAVNQSHKNILKEIKELIRP